ncbi:hypothetical protein [Botrimarina sp.]|uniref:hypothetical protein n=1 Tax=Botrimarina sp. TaxID=2795802 RepID=UPI0032EC94BD
MLANLPQRIARRSVAALLAAACLFVGATGDSLFYLFESLALVGSADEQPAEAYFHHHGDGLWHHHGAPHRGSATETESGRTDHRLSKAVAVRGGWTSGIDTLSRHDHSTLLLALASTCELSLLLAPPALEGSIADQSGAVCELSDALPLVLASLGPRGPPFEDCV